MNVRQGPETVFDRPPAEILPALAGRDGHGRERPRRVGARVLGLRAARRAARVLLCLRADARARLRDARAGHLPRDDDRARDARGERQRWCAAIAATSPSPAPGDARPGCDDRLESGELGRRPRELRLIRTDNSLFRRRGARRRLDAIRIEREMMKRLITTAAAVLAFGVLAPSAAQEGHPLKGSWLGEWQGNSVHGDNILLILDWDGKAITGMINPGTDNMPLGRRRSSRTAGSSSSRPKARTRTAAPCATSSKASSRTSSCRIARSTARGRATRAAARSRRAGNEAALRR